MTVTSYHNFLFFARGRSGIALVEMASDDEEELVRAETFLPALRHKRRSTMECMFPPLLDSPVAEGAPTITVGGDNTLQRPERFSRGILATSRRSSSSPSAGESGVGRRGGE